MYGIDCDWYEITEIDICIWDRYKSYKLFLAQTNLVFFDLSKVQKRCIIILNCTQPSNKYLKCWFSYTKTSYVIAALQWKKYKFKQEIGNG